MSRQTGPFGASRDKGPWWLRMLATPLFWVIVLFVTNILVGVWLDVF